MKIIVIVGLCLLTVVSCSRLDNEVQKDIDSNPVLQEKHISVKVIAIDNGYVTLRVESGFSQDIMEDLRNGSSPKDIWMYKNMIVEPLVKLEEIIKKRPEVKDVSWTAK